MYIYLKERNKRTPDVFVFKNKAELYDFAYYERGNVDTDFSPRDPIYKLVDSLPYCKYDQITRERFKEGKKSGEFWKIWEN